MRYFIVGVELNEDVAAVERFGQVREITGSGTVTSTVTYHDASKHGEEWGRARALKEIAALHDDPDSVERMSQRLMVSENIVDWVISYFDYIRKCRKEGTKAYGFNGHIEWHAREQKKMREQR